MKLPKAVIPLFYNRFNKSLSSLTSVDFAIMIKEKTSDTAFDPEIELDIDKEVRKCFFYFMFENILLSGHVFKQSMDLGRVN